MAGPRKLAAHRPSRKTVIVDAAIHVFATSGFADASINDVAHKAGVAVTAVYYHFSGKEELYEASVRRALSTLTEVVAAGLPGGDPVSVENLHPVIDAVWDWVDAHPKSATLLQCCLAEKELNVRRAFDHLFDAGVSLRRRASAAESARRTLALRTLVETIFAIHALPTDTGPLGGRSQAELRNSVHGVSTRLIGSGPSK